MLEILNWFATGTTIAAAALLSVNFGRLPNGIAFIIFSISSIAWIAAGLLDKEASITTQNIALLGINLVGIWRWLIRDPPKRKSSPPRTVSQVRRGRGVIRRTISGLFFGNDFREAGVSSRLGLEGVLPMKQQNKTQPNQALPKNRDAEKQPGGGARERQLQQEVRKPAQPDGDRERDSHGRFTPDYGGAGRSGGKDTPASSDR